MIDCEPRSEKTLADPLRESPASQVQNKFPESARNGNSTDQIADRKADVVARDASATRHDRPLTGSPREFPPQ